MDQKREAEIVINVLKGDRQAYALLVEEYKNPIYNLTYRMTHNLQDAEDLAQETFLRAYRELHRYDTKKRFFTWLYTISLNLIRNHLKKTNLRTTMHDVYISTGVSAHDGQQEYFNLSVSKEDSHATREKQMDIGLRKLSPELREMLVLRFYQGLSFETIADITGFSTSAVKMRIYRGLETLRKIIQKM